MENVFAILYLINKYLFPLPLKKVFNGMEFCVIADIKMTLR